MKIKFWILDIVIFILWTIAFISNFISGDISVLSYMLLYIAFLCELLKNFLTHIQE